MSEPVAAVAEKRFTLVPGRWYAAEFLGDEFALGGEPRCYSPILVYALEPLRNGRRQFRLSFYHANYPEGVRDKCYLLEMLERGEHFVLARRDEGLPVRMIFIYSVTWDWLRRHFGVEPRGEAEEIEDWLSRNA